MNSGKSGTEIWICDSCQKAVEEGKARREAGILRCPECGAELNTKIYVPTRRERVAVPGQGASNFEVRMPPWMTEKEENGMLEISYLTRVANSENTPWIFLWAIVLALYLFQTRDQMGNWQWNLGIVLAVLYLIMLVDHLFSRVRIQVTRDQLRVFRSSLIPGTGSSWKTSKVRQLYSRRRVVKSRFGQPRPNAIDEPVTYQLVLIPENGEETLFLDGLKEMQAALYIERRIETLLDIPDEAVNTEIPH